MATVDMPKRANGGDAQSGTAFKVIRRFVLVASVAVIVTMASMGIESRFSYTGSPPVIRAPDGPHWVEPENGGEESALSKLSVNELLLSTESPNLSNEVVLAAFSPGLLDEDMPIDDILLAAELKKLREFRAAVDESIFPVLPWTILAGGILPTSINVSKENRKAEEVVSRGTIRSRPPMPRPLELMKKFAFLGPNGISADVITVDESTVQVGSPVAQLGSFQNNAIAESTMLALQISYDDLIGGKKWIIQKTNFGFYSTFRLRLTGFSNFEEAAEFCAVLLVKGQDCVPATQT